MAITAKLKVDEVHLLANEKDIVGAGIAMNIGEEWPWSFKGIAHRLKLLQEGRLDMNFQAFETA